jgi:transposase InsO family protein
LLLKQHSGHSRRVARHVRVASGARRADARTGPGGQPQTGRPVDAPAGIQGLYRRRRRGCTVRDPAAELAGDLVNRQFTVDAPNRLWVTDITEHPTDEGKVFCAAVMDVYSRLIVGWSIAEHMRTELVTDALGMAILRRKPDDGSTILHSDHGTQYTSWAFGQRLRSAGLLASMGTVGDCYDNSMMESFWGTLQLEVLDSQQWKTRDDLASAIFEWIESADPSAPGGIAAIYRDLVANHARTTQVITDVAAALARGRHCLVLTQWTAHVDALTTALCDQGFNPIVLRGGMGVKTRRAALDRLHPQPDGPPLLVVATGPFIGEGFDCPALDTLFLAAPIAFKGRLIQYAGRILRPHPGKATAEIHDYHDTHTGVLASSLTKRAPGYTHLGFPDPRHTR